MNFRNFAIAYLLKRQREFQRFFQESNQFSCLLQFNLAFRKIEKEIDHEFHIDANLFTCTQCHKEQNFPFIIHRAFIDFKSLNFLPA